MKNIFYFGEKIKEYPVRVLNEREIRAGSGILFTLAMIASLNVLMVGNYFWMELFITSFLIDFFIRLFINPKFSPVLILARIFVHNQKVEYTGAPQKKFAWTIGFTLASIMFYLVVLNKIMTPFNIYICYACLIFLFFESVFGICLGCWFYNSFNKEKAKVCPGNVCEIFERKEIQKLKLSDILILLAFIFVLYLFFTYVSHSWGVIYNLHLIHGKM